MCQVRVYTLLDIMKYVREGYNEGWVGGLASGNQFMDHIGHLLAKRQHRKRLQNGPSLVKKGRLERKVKWLKARGNSPYIFCGR